MRPRAIRTAVILACTAAGIAWLVHRGPRPVIRIMTPIDEPAPFWYMLSAFPVLGMLVADAVDIFLADGFTLSLIELSSQIIVLIGLSSLRLGIYLPISGHALLVGYFIFRRLFIPPASPVQNRIELGVAFVVLIIIAYPKLFWWTDPITLTVGIVVGLIQAEMSRRFEAVLRKRRPA